MTVRLLAVLATFSGCATANPAEPSGDYLALGDSVAFGYDPLVDLKATQVAGYPEALAARRGLDVTNIACPGEATGGFMSPTGHDNGCRENRQAYPLHVEYAGTQLQAAMDYLGTHDTQLVTIDIGANDVYLLDHLCNRDIACILANFATTLGEYERNLDFIYGQLRKVYSGPIIALQIYNPYPADSTAQFALDKINGVLADRTAAHGGILADGMAAFATKGDPCESGLLIAMPDGSCDVHPSPAGAELLADAIDAVMLR